MSGEKDMLMEWVRLAKMDLSMGKHLFELHRPMPIEGICFHAQQAGEKILKYFLSTKGIEPPKTHDLQILIEMCLEFDESFNTLSKESILLSQYGVMPRYPAEYELEEHDADLALKYSENIMTFVNKLSFPSTEEDTEPENETPAVENDESEDMPC